MKFFCSLISLGFFSFIFDSATTTSISEGRKRAKEGAGLAFALPAFSGR
uniref:Uncharacterized protein n=1 Tax=Phakopsora pachyrhizi TaxID=170000 RepID=A0A0S1MJC3_PHAPC